jgi:hypothetical protein
MWVGRMSSAPGLRSSSITLMVLAFVWKSNNRRPNSRPTTTCQYVDMVPSSQTRARTSAKAASERGRAYLAQRSSRNRLAHPVQISRSSSMVRPDAKPGGQVLLHCGDSEYHFLREHQAPRPRHGRHYQLHDQDVSLGSRHGRGALFGSGQPMQHHHHRLRRIDDMGSFWFAETLKSL